MWFTSMMFETSDLFFSENQSISVAIHIDAAFRTSRRVTAGEYGFDENAPIHFVKVHSVILSFSLHDSLQSNQVCRS